MKNLLILILAGLLVGCSTRSETEKKIDAIPMEISIYRFDKAFAEAGPDDLEQLKREYPFFFPKQFHDSIWQQKLVDTLQKQIDREVLEVFPKEEELEADLHSLFQHIKYYVPQFQAPEIYTITSEVDYRNPVILKDQILVIALDTYLGSDHFFYEGIQKYTRKNMNPSQIKQDVATTYARKLISVPRERTLLAQMVYFGKELYLKDLWLPESSNAEIIGYTPEEWDWAEANEVEIWRFFIENELLYSTDSKLTPRFINPAPFSKFYLELDNESPGMIGRYLGWQIVKAYMENNEVTFDQLLIASPQAVFEDSKFKPKK